MWYNQGMARKKRKRKPKPTPPDPVQRALDAVERATGEKLSSDPDVPAKPIVDKATGNESEKDQIADDGGSIQE